MVRTQDAAKIIAMAEGTCEMVELPTEVADVDAISVLNGKPAMRACGVDEGNEIARGSLPKLRQAPTRRLRKRQR